MLWWTALQKRVRTFGLTIIKGKTKVLGQDTTTPPEIALDGTTIEVVQNFVYLGSNISSNASIDSEIDSRISKSFTTFSRLSAGVWENPKLNMSTKVAVYSSCVLSTLLYIWQLKKRRLKNTGKEKEKELQHLLLAKNIPAMFLLLFLLCCVLHHPLICVCIYRTVSRNWMQMNANFWLRCF